MLDSVLLYLEMSSGRGSWVGRGHAEIAISGIRCVYNGCVEHRVGAWESVGSRKRQRVWTALQFHCRLHTVTWLIY